MREQQQFWLTVIIFGSIFVILSGGIYYFQWYSRVQPLQKEIKTLKEDISRMDKKIEKIPNLRKQKDDLQQKQKAFQKRLLSLEESDPQTLYEEFNAIAFRAQVDHKSYSISDDSGSARGRGGGGNNIYQKKTFEITVQGPIWNLFEYIWLIEDQKRLLRIESFQMQVSQEEVPRNRFNLGQSTQNKEDEEPNVIEMYIGTLNLKLAAFVQQ